MGIIGVHSIFFFVADLERSKAFYRALFDIEPIENSPSIASFSLGGVELMLHVDGEISRIPPNGPRGTGMAVHVQVEGIDLLWQRLHAQGFQLLEPPTKQPWGFTEFGMLDPDGYHVEFVERS